MVTLEAFVAYARGTYAEKRAEGLAKKQPDNGEKWVQAWLTALRKGCRPPIDLVLSRPRQRYARQIFARYDDDLSGHLLRLQ